MPESPKTCPRCGSEAQPDVDDSRRVWYTCGSYGIDGAVDHQSDLCDAREEIADLKALLARVTFERDECLGTPPP